MILRGIDRAHDIDCGPSNGTHTRGPVSGGLVQPAPPIPSGRKQPPKPKVDVYATRRAPNRCGLFMPISGRLCVLRDGHKNHHKAARWQGPMA